MSVEEYLQQLKNVNREAAEILSKITDDQMNHQSERGRWSIGQCFTHLIVSGRVEMPHLQCAIHGGRQRGLLGEPPFRYGFLGNWFVRSMDTTSRLKFRAPKVYVPPASVFRVRDLATDFWSLQKDFQVCLEEAAGLHLARIRVTTEVTRFASFSLGQAFALTLAHERRHLRQALQVRTQMSLGSSS